MPIFFGPVFSRPTLLPKKLTSPTTRNMILLMFIYLCDPSGFSTRQLVPLPGVIATFKSATTMPSSSKLCIRRSLNLFSRGVSTTGMLSMTRVKECLCHIASARYHGREPRRPFANKTFQDVCPNSKFGKRHVWFVEALLLSWV